MRSNSQQRINNRNIRPGVGTQSTYLVDHHPQMFADLESHPLPTTSSRKHVTSNFASTMPRKMPGTTTTSSQHQPSRTSTFTRSAGSRPPPQPQARHYDAEEMRRQAYIQSLGTYYIYVQEKSCKQENTMSGLEIGHF